MTDKEKLEQLLTEFGVGFKNHDPANPEWPTGPNCISCFGSDARIDGYGGFYTLFEFDEQGKFIKMGAWE